MANKPIVPPANFDFSDFSANYPTQQQPGNELDDEYAQLRQTDRELIAWLERSTDDDGRLAYQIVEPRNFSNDSLLLVESGWVYRGEWTSGTGYTPGDYVTVSDANSSYICLTGHTSDVDFASDYARGYWGLIFQAGVDGDVVGPPGSSAGELAVYQDSTGKLLGNSNVLLTAVARRDEANYLQGTQFFGAQGSEEAMIAAYDAGDGLVLGRIRPGQADFDFLDGGVLLTDGETRVYGAAVQVAALAGGDGYQVYVTADGYLYPVAPPDPGWSVSDTDTGSYATGTGTGLGPWVRFTGLEITTPEEVVGTDRLIYQVVTQLQNVTTNRSGTVAVGVGVDGAEPIGAGISHTITPGFDGAVITGLSVEGQTLTAGTLLSVWFRRVSGDNAQFGVTADGSTNPHSLLVEKGASGGGPGGGVSGPGTSTPGAVATWSGTTGDLLADSNKLTSQLPQLNQSNVYTQSQIIQVTGATADMLIDGTLAGFSLYGRSNAADKRRWSFQTGNDAFALNQLNDLADYLRSSLIDYHGGTDGSSAGLTVGLPAGGPKGVGTLHVQNELWVDDVQVVAGGAGRVSLGTFGLDGGLSFIDMPQVLLDGYREFEVVISDAIGTDATVECGVQWLDDLDAVLSAAGYTYEGSRTVGGTPGTTSSANYPRIRVNSAAAFNGADSSYWKITIDRMQSTKPKLLWDGCFDSNGTGAHVWGNGHYNAAATIRGLRFAAFSGTATMLAGATATVWGIPA